MLAERVPVQRLTKEEAFILVRYVMQLEGNGPLAIAPEEAVAEMARLAQHSEGIRRRLTERLGSDSVRVELVS